MSHPERRRGPGAVGLQELARLLSERDLAVLQLVAEHRFLTTRQIEQLVFTGHATSDSAARSCRRVLARLETRGLMERPIRRVGGLQAGSASSVWMLTSAGKRLCNLHAGLGAVGRVREPGERFIQHYLAIGNARLALVAADRVHRLELLRMQIEPQCWRSFPGLGGGTVTLKPDLYAVIGSGDYEDHWFIEIDRATESLPVLIRQCQQYQAYRRSGIEQAATGIFPRVLWVVPDDQRATRLRDALAATRALDANLFLVTTTEHFLPAITGSPA